jgi:ABC-2 type transport system permease protein
MKTFFTLLNREMKSYFYSPIAYVVLCFFWILMGGLTCLILAANNGYPSETPIVQQFFAGAFFWFPFILIFPLITMRIYSEEFRMGTVESLTTAPVTDLQIVLSKLAATFLFSCMLLLPSLLFFAGYSRVTGHAAAGATGAYLTSYLLLLLMSLFYCSIGCFASALTKDQINAAMISFTVIIVLFLLGFVFDIFGITTQAAREAQSYVSPLGHMADFSKGIIDSRPIVFYSSMTVFITFLTFHVFQYRKWKF